MEVTSAYGKNWVVNSLEQAIFYVSDPLQAVKIGRHATEIMRGCKHSLMRLNIKAGVLVKVHSSFPESGMYRVLSPSKKTRVLRVINLMTC